VQCDSLKKAPAQIEAFAPSADQMRAHFESLVLAMMTHSTKLPAAPFEESPFEGNHRPVSRCRFRSTPGLSLLFRFLVAKSLPTILLRAWNLVLLALHLPLVSATAP
jgi:hypothetical protein